MLVLIMLGRNHAKVSTAFPVEDDLSWGQWITFAYSNEAVSKSS